MLIERMKAMPGHLLRRLQQISSARFAEGMGDYDLTAVQLAALVAVSEIPDVDATRLAEVICLDRATVGDVIVRLERKGLIARTRGESDRRTKVLVATGRAKLLIRACSGRLEAVQASLLAGLSTAERATFLRLLRKLVSAADGRERQGN